MASKIFLFSISLIAILVNVSGFASGNPQALPFQLLFLPVTIYLIRSSYLLIRYDRIEVVLSDKKGVLLIYLVFFAALLLLSLAGLL